jgi:hypothetical protein
MKLQTKQSESVGGENENIKIINHEKIWIITAAIC